MSEIEQKTDYSTGLNLLLAQFKNSIKLRGMIDSAYDSADDLEKALFEIRDEFWLDVAVGTQLDTIGEIFNEGRNGDVDADYRLRIQAKASLVASGEPEGIIAILKSLFGATYVTYIPGWPALPATYYIITDGTITLAILEKYSPAGVQPLLLEPLRFEDDDSIIEYQDTDYIYIRKQ
jgi:hypothetical protein